MHSVAAVARSRQVRQPIPRTVLSHEDTALSAVRSRHARIPERLVVSLSRVGRDHFLAVCMVSMIAGTIVFAPVRVSHVVFLALLSAVVVLLVVVIVFVVVGFALDTDVERQGDVLDGTELSTVVQMLVLQAEKVPLPATRTDQRVGKKTTGWNVSGVPGFVVMKYLKNQISLPKNFNKGQSKRQDVDVDVQRQEPHNPRKPAQKIQHNRKVVHPCPRVDQLLSQERVSIGSPAVLAEPEEPPVHVYIPQKCVHTRKSGHDDVGNFEGLSAIVPVRKVDKQVDEARGVFASVQQMGKPLERVAVTAQTL